MYLYEIITNTFSALVFQAAKVGRLADASNQDELLNKTQRKFVNLSILQSVFFINCDMYIVNPSNFCNIIGEMFLHHLIPTVIPTICKTNVGSQA